MKWEEVNFKGELQLNHAVSILSVVENFAIDYKENYLDICEDTTQLSEIDYCRNIAWDWVDDKLILENLKMQRS